jgi:hypothetical protein
MARSSARAKVATAQRRGRAVGNGRVARRAPTAAKRPSPGCTGDAPPAHSTPMLAAERRRGRRRDPSQYRLAWGPRRQARPLVRGAARPTPNRLGQRFAAESRAHGRRAGRLAAARRGVGGSRVSSTPTNSHPASRTAARLRNPTGRRPAPSGGSTDAAEESSADAHTPRRCALSPSRERSSAGPVRFEQYGKPWPLGSAAAPPNAAYERSVRESPKWRRALVSTTMRSPQSRRARRLDRHGMPWSATTVVTVPEFEHDLRPVSPAWPVVRAMGANLGPRRGGYRSRVAADPRLS